MTRQERISNLEFEEDLKKQLQVSGGLTIKEVRQRQVVNNKVLSDKLFPNKEEEGEVSWKTQV